ncbi:MAG TPA: diguanylate cyclase [Gaiellaceae bacterium]|nr:diguanylate cyclase [Gaiellaceae bacterium]
MNPRRMGSFKVKLVVYFLLLSLLPIAAAFWGFTAVAGQSETRRVDARLQAGLRAALATYQERLDAAQRDAASLARSRPFVTELEQRDLPAIVDDLRGSSNVSVTAVNGFHYGHIPALSATRSVDVVTDQGLVGTVTVGVPFDTQLVEELRRRSGLADSDSLAVLLNGRVIASAPTVDGTVRAGPGQTRTTRVGGSRYRVLVAPAVAEDQRVRLAVLSPQSLIDAANASSRNRLLLGLLLSLALVSIVAYFEGRSIVRTLRSLAEAAHGIARGRFEERVPVRGRDEFALLGTAFNEMAGQLEARIADLDEERGRLRVAITRFGEALAATHDVGQLLRVIVEAAVEATGAEGARLHAHDGTTVVTGNPEADGVRLELPLTAGRNAFGTLTLVGRSFDEEQAMTAGSLASHAAIALENARLHQIVERQALVDGLTGIANRRQCEDALHSEIARAERLGTPLTLVLADLDDFKAINDLHGHAVGDDVLREFAAVLRATVRESDLPGRWGGEEFLLLLPGTDADGGAQLADRVRRALAERSFRGRNGEVFNVTCSFGLAQHAPGGDERDLFAAADRALYRAKRRGKNCVEVNERVRSF